MRDLALLALSVVAGLLLAGCAPSEIRVTSDPPNARVIVGRGMSNARITENDEPKVPAGACWYSGRTPATFSIPHGGAWTIFVAKSGFETAVRDVDRTTRDHHFTLERKP